MAENPHRMCVVQEGSTKFYYIQKKRNSSAQRFLQSSRSRSQDYGNWHSKPVGFVYDSRGGPPSGVHRGDGREKDCQPCDLPYNPRRDSFPEYGRNAYFDSSQRSRPWNRQGAGYGRWESPGPEPRYNNHYFQPRRQQEVNSGSKTAHEIGCYKREDGTWTCFDKPKRQGVRFAPSPHRDTRHKSPMADGFRNYQEESMDSSIHANSVCYPCGLEGTDRSYHEDKPRRARPTPQDGYMPYYLRESLRSKSVDSRTPQKFSQPQQNQKPQKSSIRSQKDESPSDSNRERSQSIPAGGLTNDATDIYSHDKLGSEISKYSQYETRWDGGPPGSRESVASHVDDPALVPRRDSNLKGDHDTRGASSISAELGSPGVSDAPSDKRASAPPESVTSTISPAALYPTRGSSFKDSYDPKGASSLATQVVENTNNESGSLSDPKAKKSSDEQEAPEHDAERKHQQVKRREYNNLECEQRTETLDQDGRLNVEYKNSKKSVGDESLKKYLDDDQTSSLDEKRIRENIVPTNDEEEHASISGQKSRSFSEDSSTKANSFVGRKHGKFSGNATYEYSDSSQGAKDVKGRMNNKSTVPLEASEEYQKINLVTKRQSVVSKKIRKRSSVRQVSDVKANSETPQSSVTDSQSVVRTPETTMEKPNAGNEDNTERKVKTYAETNMNIRSFYEQATRAEHHERTEKLVRERNTERYQISSEQSVEGNPSSSEVDDEDWTLDGEGNRVRKWKRREAQ